MPRFDPDQIKKAAMEAGKVPDQPRQSSQPSDPNSVGAAPYLALIGGAAADGLSTIHNFDRGYAESNPAYNWMGPQNKVGVLAMKGLQTAGAAYAMKKLAEHGHPGAAKALGYIMGGSSGSAAAFNMMKPDLK